MEELQPDAISSRTPLFQVLFNMMNFGDSATLDLPGLQVEPAALSARAWEVQSKFDLTLYARDDAEGLTLTAVYNADLFADERMADLLDQLVQLLTAVAADPDVDIRALLAADAGGGPRGARSDGRAGRRLDGVVDRALPPPRPARPSAAGRGDADPHVVVQRAGSLEQPAGSSLERPRRGAGDRVAIYADRSAGLAWALLGVLKAGAAFMCLDSGVSGGPRGGLSAGRAAARVHPPRGCRPGARGDRRAPDADRRGC